MTKNASLLTPEKIFTETAVTGNISHPPSECRICPHIFTGHKSGSKLFQKTLVVIVIKAYIVYAVFEHGNTFYAQPKGKT